MKTLLSLGLALVIAASLLAAGDQAPGKKKRRPKRPDPAAQILKKLEKAELTDEQIAKIKELCAQASEKIQAARKKAGLTPEQRKARFEAMKKAKEEGKKGKELAEAVRAAVKLAPEQEAALQEARKLMGELTRQCLALLSPEQKEKAGIKRHARKKHGAGKRHGKKKAGQESNA